MGWGAEVKGSGRDGSHTGPEEPLSPSPPGSRALKVEGPECRRGDPAQRKR